MHTTERITLEYRHRQTILVYSVGCPDPLCTVISDSQVGAYVP